MEDRELVASRRSPPYGTGSRRPGRTAAFITQRSVHLNRGIMNILTVTVTKECHTVAVSHWQALDRAPNRLRNKTQRTCLPGEHSIGS